MKLRLYQKEDLTKILSSLQSNTGVLYQLVTGGGKSVIISEVVLHYHDKKILFLAHRRELLLQMRTRLIKSGLQVGVMMSDMEEELDDNIVVASIQTAIRSKRIDSLLQHDWDMIIIDEAHHLRSPSYDKLLDILIKNNPGVKLFGVTATPYRSDKKDFGLYFQDLITSVEPSVLVQQGFLSDIQVLSCKLSDIDKEVVRYDNDYQASSLSLYMRKPKYLQYLVDIYREKADGKQMIVFCVDTQHASMVIETYKSNGYTSLGYIDSMTTLQDRDSILSSFREGSLQIIVCIETLTEGVDLPETNVVQIARPTKSIILYLQMVGRGTRPKKDGSKLILLDCGNCMLEHGHPYSPKEWSLNGEVDPNHKRKNKKIVRRKKHNNTFIFTDFEDIEEGEFDELVEMSFEDYLINVSSSIDNLKNKNKELEQLKLDKKQELLNFILSKIPEKHQSTRWVAELERYSDEVYKIEDTTTTYSLTFRLRRGDIVLEITYDSWKGSRGTSSEQHRVYETLLHLSSLLQQGKFKQQILDFINEILSFDSKKVDINQLEREIVQLKKDRVLIELDTVLKQKGGILVLTSRFNIGSFFSREWGYFNKIVFSRDKVLSTNEITFFDGSREVYMSRFVDKVKLQEIFTTIDLQKHILSQELEKSA